MYGNVIDGAAFIAGVTNTISTNIIAANTAITVPLSLITGQAANTVIGQAGMNSGSANQGGPVIPSGLNFPASSAFDPSGDLWVADTSNNRVMEFRPPFSTDEAASVILGGGVSGTSSTSLSSPGGVAFDSSGNLWVADSNNNRVMEFLPANFINGGAAAVVIGQTSMTSTGGGSRNPVSSNTLYNPYSPAFDSSGDLWVVDSGNNRMLEFLPANLVTNGAAAVAIGCADLIGDGCGGTNQVGLSGPTGAAFDSSGDLWVADSGNNRVMEFLPANLVTSGAAAIVIGQTSMTNSKTGTSSNTLRGPYAITFDSSGDLWVADSSNNRVLEFKPSFSTNEAASVVIGQTSMTGTAGGYGQSSSTVLASPIDLAFDSSGDLWVVDLFNSRVLEYLPLNTALASSNAIVDQGQTETLTYTISGGSQPYTYNFMVTNTATGNVIASQIFAGCTLTTNSFTFTLPSSGGYAANAVGSLTVYGNVIDSALFTAGVTNIISTSTVAANAAVTAMSLALSNAIMDQGQIEKLTYIISGGSQPYTYNFMVTNTATGNVIASQIFTGCTLATNTFTFTLPSSGGYAKNAVGSLTVYGNVIDSALFTAGVTNIISTSAFAASTTPSITITPGTNPIVVGNPIFGGINPTETYTLTVTGGTGGFNTEFYNVTGSTQLGSNVLIPSPGSTGSYHSWSIIRAHWYSTR